MKIQSSDGRVLKVFPQDEKAVRNMIESGNHEGVEAYFKKAESESFKKGGMLKRKDGSYSRRGLWDNIRANRGSGKKPTKEMLKQEAKIRAKAKDGLKVGYTGPKSMAEAEAMIADGRLKVSAPNNDGAKAIKYMVDVAGMVNYPASLLGAAWDLTQGDINGAVAGAIPFGTGLQAIKAAGQLGKAAGGGRKAIRATNNLGIMHVGSQAKDTYDDVVTPLRTTKAAGGTVFKGYVTEQPMGDAVPWHTSTIGEPETYGRGGYTVKRSSARKGKTHVVIGPDGTKKYFGDSKLGQHPGNPKRKKAFYARHAKNLKGNPYFRAFARATWADGGKLRLSDNMYENIGVMPYGMGGHIQEGSMSHLYSPHLEESVDLMYADGGYTLNPAVYGPNGNINPYTGMINGPDTPAYNERYQYGFGGNILKGLGDIGLYAADNVTSIINKDIIGDKRYSDTGFGNAVKNVSHVTGAITNSLAPLAATAIGGPAAGMAMSAAQQASNQFVKPDQERLQSTSNQIGQGIGSALNIASAFYNPMMARYGGYTHMADGGINLTSQPVVGAFGNTPKYSQTIAPTEVLGSKNSRRYIGERIHDTGQSFPDYKNDEYIPAIVGYNPETFTDPKIQDYFYRLYPRKDVYTAPTEYDSKGNPVIYKNYFIDHKTGKRQDGHGYMYSPHRFIGRYNNFVGSEKATREECPECYDEAFKEGKVGAPENYMMPNGINYNYQDLIKAYPSMRDPRVFKKAFNKDAPKMADGGQAGLVPINVEGGNFSEGSGPDAKKGELLVLNGKIVKNYVGRPPHPIEGQNPMGNDDAPEGLIVIPKARTKEYLEAGLIKRKQMEISIVSQQKDREMKKSKQMGDGGYYSFGMGEMGMAQGGPIGNPEEINDFTYGTMKKGGWIQKATASIKRRGTEGVCTGSKFGSSSCPPGSRRYNLAKTFRKMAKARKHAEGGYTNPDSAFAANQWINYRNNPDYLRGVFNTGIKNRDVMSGITGATEYMKNKVVLTNPEVVRFAKYGIPQHLENSLSPYDLSRIEKAKNYKPSKKYGGFVDPVTGQVPNMYGQGGQLPESLLRTRMRASGASPEEINDYVADNYAMGGNVNPNYSYGRAIVNRGRFEMGGPTDVDKSIVYAGMRERAMAENGLMLGLEPAAGSFDYSGEGFPAIFGSVTPLTMSANQLIGGTPLPPVLKDYNYTGPGSLTSWGSSAGATPSVPTKTDFGWKGNPYLSPTDVPVTKMTPYTPKVNTNMSLRQQSYPTSNFSDFLNSSESDSPLMMGPDGNVYSMNPNASQSDLNRFFKNSAQGIEDPRSNTDLDKAMKLYGILGGAGSLAKVGEGLLSKSEEYKRMPLRRRAAKLLNPREALADQSRTAAGYKYALRQTGPNQRLGLTTLAGKDYAARAGIYGTYDNANAQIRNAETEALVRDQLALMQQDQYAQNFDALSRAARRNMTREGITDLVGTAGNFANMMAQKQYLDKMASAGNIG